MSKAFKMVGAVLGLILLAAAGYLTYKLYDLNAFDTITPHFAGQCIKLHGATGAEDIAVDHIANVAYVSASDRMHKKAVDGIYRLDLSGAPDAQAQLHYMPVEGIADFHPHGIDLRRLPDGSLRLFVVNHPQGQSSVEILRIEDGRLVHEKTVTDELFVAPNDVVSVSTDGFYVTNDAPSGESDMTSIAKRLFLPHEMTTVIFWDGTKARVAAQDLDGANGIQASADGTQVYVNEWIGKKFNVFTREGDNSLRLKESVDVGMSADNISMNPDGTLLIAGVPSLYRAIEVYILGREGTVPSEVMKITPSRNEAASTVQSIYVDQGDEMPSVTVATPFSGDMFLMGNAFNDLVVVCRPD